MTVFCSLEIMSWFKTKTAVTIGLVLLVAGAGLVAKRIFWPVDDSVFVLDSRRLEKAPSGVVLLRPTHFPNSRVSGMFTRGFSPKPGKRAMRMIGRNVSLAAVIQMAYRCNSSRIVLPPNPPKDNFDFLVTVSDKPEERLQTAIKKKLGYVARWETRETDVLLLKVQTPNAPGLKRSTKEGSEEDGRYNNGKLSFKHQPLSGLTGFLEYMLKQPVLDKTGLTDFYDYSVDWNQHIRTGTLNRNDFNKSLRDMGLALVSGSESLEMLVVETAQ
jgi:uncharacterized protein (TIGR03435 family)